MSNDAPELSKHAVTLLNKLRRGHWVMAYGRRPTAALLELEEKGYVTTAMRPATFQRAYVPTTGYTPSVPERYQDAE